MVMIVAIIVFGIINPNFLTPNTLSLVMKQITVVGIVAIAQTLIILTAGIDLSVGAILVLSSIIMGKLSVEVGVPVPLAIMIGMFFGSLMGFVNGILVTLAKLPPFIVTLGTLSIFTSLKLWYSKSQSIRPADLNEHAPSLLWFGKSFSIGSASLIYGVVALILLAIAVSYILRQTPWGRHVYAIGDDPEAASLSGINVNRTLIEVYVFAGAICGFAGWVAAGRVGSISPIGFETANLDSITAVVIGGTSLFGGRGGIAGSVLGAIIVGVFNTGLVLARVDDYWQQFAIGCLVIVAVALDQWIRRATK
jgi:fructose transport system permease protein